MTSRKSILEKLEMVDKDDLIRDLANWLSVEDLREFAEANYPDVMEDEDPEDPEDPEDEPPEDEDSENPVKATYPGGVCPDCYTEIPDDVNPDDSCSNCGHAFWGYPIAG